MPDQTWTITVRSDPHDGLYVGECTEMPDAVGQGDTPAEALLSTAGAAAALLDAGTGQPLDARDRQRRAFLGRGGALPPDRALLTMAAALDHAARKYRGDTTTSVVVATLTALDIFGYRLIQVGRPRRIPMVLCDRCDDWRRDDGTCNCPPDPGATP